MMEWQPIETAPKDGKIVLTCWGDIVSTAAMIEGEDKRWFIVIPPRTFGDLYWQKMVNTEWEPTHWMPLPKPPLASQSRE